MRTVMAPKTYPTSVAQFRLKLNGERKDPSKGPYGSSKRCNLPTLGTYHSFHSTTTSYMTTVNTWAHREGRNQRTELGAISKREKLDRKYYFPFFNLGNLEKLKFDLPVNNHLRNCIQGFSCSSTASNKVKIIEP